VQLTTSAHAPQDT